MTTTSRQFSALSRSALLAIGVVIALLVTSCSGNTTQDPEDTRGPELQDTSGPETATSPPTATVTTTPTTVDTSLYYTPLVIEKGDVTVTFDRWFFILQDRDTRVEVRNSAGTVLAEGTVAGPEAIMRETADHSFEFVDPSGKVVAVITQQELNEAADAARAAAEN